MAATAGPIVDVGSGGGTPGIPLAATFPARSVTLLEAQRRKCRFLEAWAAELPNVSVVWGRAEEQEPEQFGVAVAKALAHPADCRRMVPSARAGGRARRALGRETAEPEQVAAVARRIAGELEDAPPGLARDPQDRSDAARVPAAGGRREEAASCLILRRRGGFGPSPARSARPGERADPQRVRPPG